MLELSIKLSKTAQGGEGSLCGARAFSPCIARVPCVGVG